MYRQLKFNLQKGFRQLWGSRADRWRSPPTAVMKKKQRYAGRNEWQTTGASQPREQLSSQHVTHQNAITAHPHKKWGSTGFVSSQIRLCIISHLRGVKDHLPAVKGHGLDWSNLSCRIREEGKQCPAPSPPSPLEGLTTARFGFQQFCCTKPIPFFVPQKSHTVLSLGLQELKQSGERENHTSETNTQWAHRSESAIRAQSSQGRPSASRYYTAAWCRLGTSWLSRGCPFMRTARTVTQPLDEARQWKNFYCWKGRLQSVSCCRSASGWMRLEVLHQLCLQTGFYLQFMTEMQHFTVVLKRDRWQKLSHSNHIFYSTRCCCVVPAHLSTPTSIQVLPVHICFSTHPPPVPYTPT